MAEYAVTIAKNCIPLLDEITLEEGASSQVNPLTAVCLVNRLKELKVKACIISAAAS